MATWPRVGTVSRAKSAASRDRAGPAAKVRSNGHGACTAAPGSRPSARSVASSLAIPNRTPLPDTQNNDSRDSAVITPLVYVTKLAAPGNTSTWVATTDAGARSSRTSRTIRLSIDGGTGSPRPL